MRVMKKLLLLLSVFVYSSDGLWSTFNRVGQMAWDSVNDNIPDTLNPLNLVYSNSCILDLGCFYTGPPFYHPIQRPLSLSPTSKIDKIKFRLFTPDNPDEEYLLKPDQESIQKSKFNPNYPTKVLIHGFLVSMNSEDIRFQMKDAILGIGDYNVIITDWTGINSPPYSQAVSNTRVVGALLAKLIHSLMENKGVDAQSFHLIGHSLGGQAAGYAGERINNLGRITGLDPAGPWFRTNEPEVRLDPTDALFVDVIHTDGSEFILTGLGTSPPIGLMDFYPNGGSHQPGCVITSNWDNVIGSAINDTARYMNPGCDHGRANDFFLESIDNSHCKFLAVQCANYTDYEKGLCQPGEFPVAEMGFHNKRVPGLEYPAKFYLRTYPDTPYCNQDSIKIEAPRKPQAADLKWFSLP